MKAPLAAWRRVAAELVAQAEKCTLVPVAIAERAGMSRAHVENLMQHKKLSYRDDSLYRVAEAVGWTRDSIHRILRGEEPIPVYTGTAHIDLSGPEFASAPEVRGYGPRLEKLTPAQKAALDALLDAFDELPTRPDEK